MQSFNRILFLLIFIFSTSACEPYKSANDGTIGSSDNSTLSEGANNNSNNNNGGSSEPPATTPAPPAPQPEPPMMPPAPQPEPPMMPPAPQPEPPMMPPAPQPEPPMMPPEPPPVPMPTPGGENGACTEYNFTYDPADFDNVIDDHVSNQTLRLVGSQWDNTLVRNCRISNTSGDGIFIRDVKNVVIVGCEISNIGGHSGIRTSTSGSTQDIIIDGNYIHNTANNGINIPQRVGAGVNSDNALVINNRVSNTGTSRSDGKVHHIYSQSQGAIISGNTLSGSRDGNAITFRSSGRISCNHITGNSKARKPGIRYYSDHHTGSPSTLVIENNNVSGQDIGINIFRPVNRYDGATPNGHVVKNFVIRNNTVRNNTAAVVVDSVYSRSPFSVTNSGNN